MAVASAAATAALISMDDASLEPVALLGTAAVATAADPRDGVISWPAPESRDRASTRSDDAPATPLTADAVEMALAVTPEERRDLVLSELLEQLTHHDAPAAARLAERLERGYLREAALRTVAQHWPRFDAESAIAWAASLGEQAERDTALANVALELVITEPRLALQVLGRRSASPSPDAVLEGAMQQWAANDFESAYAWADAQPAGPDRDALLMRLVFARAEQSPSDAARIATNAIHDETRRLEATSTVALRWGAHDPAAVREWARSLDAKARQRVRAELALLE